MMPLKVPYRLRNIQIFENRDLMSMKRKKKNFGYTDENVEHTV